MTEEREKIHCLHICGHLDAMMQDAANKREAERQQAKKPNIECNTSEDSNQLHEMYKDRVQNTEPSEEKRQMMREMMQAIEQAKLAHNLMLLHAKEEEFGVKRHPSTLSHMHHDDSDSEGEVEEFENRDRGEAEQAQSISVDRENDMTTLPAGENNEIGESDDTTGDARADDMVEM